MKKMITKLNMAVVGIMCSAPAFANPNMQGVCGLISKMHDVFVILRTLAFVGAAFIIADWAWGWIKSGDVKRDDIQTKGTGMLVGFVVLFSIGVVLSFFMSTAGLETLGCQEVLLNW